MPEEYVIEEPGPEDVDAIVGLEAVSFTSPWRAGFFASELGAGGRYNRVARDRERKVIGYLFAMFFIDEMHVNKIAVAPSMRRRGVATALMEDLTKFARENGIRTISLEVRESNSEAQRFYQGLRFQPTYVRKRYYPDGESAIVMGVELR